MSDKKFGKRLEVEGPTACSNTMNYVDEVKKTQPEAGECGEEFHIRGLGPRLSPTPDFGL